MPKSRTTSAPTDSPKPPVQAVRDCADALFRAATECCRQHDRMSRMHSKSDIEDELEDVRRMCELCHDTLHTLTEKYAETSANVHPTGADEIWWRHANSLWLASREYLRRHTGCEAASRELKQHGPERLSGLHTEYELEGSALLGLRHAAEAYQQDRPTAA